MKTCTVGNTPNCAELKNGNFKLAITQEFGPRILGGYYGNSKNIFVELPPKPLGIDTGFIHYGGHRLWHSPEVNPRTYYPDNAPVQVTKLKNGLQFTSPIEETTRTQKIISITKLDDELFKISHSIINHNPWEISMAAWAISMMAPGGTVVIPQNNDTSRNNYAPDRLLALWPYTQFNDKRIKMDDQFLYICHNPKIKAPMKVGYNTGANCWCAYVNNGIAFVKYALQYDLNEQCPDMNCNVESYACDLFCEMETIGKLTRVQPGECAYHDEIWQIIPEVPAIKSAKDVATFILPKLLKL